MIGRAEEVVWVLRDDLELAELPRPQHVEELYRRFGSLIRLVRTQGSSSFHAYNPASGLGAAFVPHHFHGWEELHAKTHEFAHSLFAHGLASVLDQIALARGGDVRIERLSKVTGWREESDANRFCDEWFAPAGLLESYRDSEIAEVTTAPACWIRERRRRARRRAEQELFEAEITGRRPRLALGWEGVRW